MKELRGRVAVITGGAGGIGRALAERFVAEGMKVVVADVEAAALDATVTELAAGGGDVVGVPTDVTSAESVEALAAAAYERHGAVHVLCNNAGVGPPSAKVWETTPNDWRWTFEVNVFGVVNGLNVFMPHMVEHGEDGHAWGNACRVCRAPHYHPGHGDRGRCRQAVGDFPRAPGAGTGSQRGPGPADPRPAEGRRNVQRHLQRTSGDDRGEDSEALRWRSTARSSPCNSESGPTEGVMGKLKPMGLLIFLLALVVSTPASAAAPTPAEVKQEKDEIRKKTKEILAQLYKAEPSAKATINKAAGYAVFSNFGMKIFVAGSGTGKGIAVSNKTKKEVFMKMIELQGGLGMGVKKFNLVWVFETPDKLDTFVNSGWEIGAQTSAAAKVGDKGGAYQGAMAVSPGIWLYQLTESGLALELTAKGTKYYKNDELN